MPRLKIAHVASEVLPLAKTGGLADVVGTLARAHEKSGQRPTIFMPYYREVRRLAKAEPQPVVPSLPIHLAPGIREEVSILQVQLPSSKIPVFLVHNPKAFDRDHIYGTPDGDYPDNADRFILFCRAVLQAIKEMNEAYDILHCHDWQTALIPAYLRRLYAGEPVFGRTATLFTIHNLAYQGIFAKDTIVRTGLGWEMFTPDQLEFFGKVNFMKAGILYADKISTVSPGYAREILTPEYGFGLEGLLKTRENDLVGVMNGINYEEWDPSGDTLIAAPYGRKDLAGKRACKEALVREAGLPPSDRGKMMLIGAVSRMAEQKGFDLVAEAAGKLAKRPVQMVILGSGDRRVLDMLRDLGRRYPAQIVFREKYDPGFARRIYAGADAFMMPSRFEPCGLGQMIAMRYGTMPIVRETGGLLDTVRPVDARRKTGTGFTFKAATADALLKAVDDALAAFSDDDLWQKLMLEAMAEDFSWTASAKKYESLYQQCRDKRAKG